jgi:hypothetical protein
MTASDWTGETDWRRTRALLSWQVTGGQERDPILEVEEEDGEHEYDGCHCAHWSSSFDPCCWCGSTTDSDDDRCPGPLDPQNEPGRRTT